MSKRDELLALADRCEVATGEDRGIDCWIENHLGLARFVPDRPAPLGGGWLDKRVDPKSYTASLDAAMTLVPEGWNWMAGNRDQPLARAYVNNGELAFVGAGMRRNPNRQWYETTAATPALALCTAALRARAAMEGI